MRLVEVELEPAADRSRRRTPSQNRSSGASARIRPSSESMSSALRPRGALSRTCGDGLPSAARSPNSACSSSMPGSPARLAQRDSSSSCRSRDSQPHGSNAFGQRGWNEQPSGGRAASGTSPRGRSRGTRRRVGLGDGAQQRLRVRVLRVGVDRVRRPDLDDPPEVHDRDPVAEELARREVVRDVEVGEVEVAASGRA